MIQTPSPTSDRPSGHGNGRPRASLGWCLAALFAVAIASTPGVAVASPAGEAKAAARKKLVEGADLLKHGDFQAALARFQAAYDLVPNPKIQYNFGLAYMGLGRNADAFQAFLAFLGEASDASTDTITKARGYKDGLVQKICRLTVRADADGATIGVDARSYGLTPRREEILLDAGTHVLLVEKAGVGRRFSRTFEAVPGGSLTLEATLLAIEPDPLASTSAPPSGNTEAMVTAPPSRPNPASGSRAARWTGLVVGGLAVAALGFGTVEWVVKEQKYRSFNDDPFCGSKTPEQGGGNCPTLKHDGDKAKGLAYAGFAAAGVLGAVSAVFLVVSRGGFTKSGTETALACGPSLTAPGGACSWRF
jgi:hypothetical protein